MAALEKIKVHQLDGPVGQIDSIVEGENVTVDSTDPRNPVVSVALPPPPTVLVPLTTVVGGSPELVWDNENNLVMTEVSV